MATDTSHGRENYWKRDKGKKRQERRKNVGMRKEAQVAELSMRWELSVEMWNTSAPQIQKLTED